MTLASFNANVRAQVTKSMDSGSSQRNIITLTINTKGQSNKAKGYHIHVPIILFCYSIFSLDYSIPERERERERLRPLARQ